MIVCPHSPDSSMCRVRAAHTHQELLSSSSHHSYWPYESGAAPLVHSSLLKACEGGREGGREGGKEGGMTHMHTLN